MAERLLWEQEAPGSNPGTPTTLTWEFPVLYLTRNLEWQSTGELGQCPVHSVAMPSIAFVARRDMT